MKHKMKHSDVVKFCDKHSLVIYIYHLILLTPILLISFFKLEEVITLNRKLELSLGVLGAILFISFSFYFCFEYKNKIGNFKKRK